MATRAHRMNLSAGIVAVGTAGLLVLLKLWALLQTGALSIGASLADSALDLLMSGGGLLAVAYAARPADEDHAFGHSAVEDIAGLAQAAFITASALLLLVTALARLTSGDPPQLEAEGVGLAVMLLSIVMTLGLVLWQRRVAGLTGNRVVAADALHYTGDLIPALGALAALAASALWGWTWLDPLVAIGAAVFLLRGAIGIGHVAFDALMDRRVDPDVLSRIARLAGSFPGVLGHHDLKTRRSGSRLFVNLHIELDGAQTLEQAHDIGAALRRAIVAIYPEADVLIHKDPVGVEPHPDDGRRSGS
ncbi:cation diffusion facilitator family transporter [Pseudoroseicyclus tamaricis]|uniref:Cation diffusion facilitator family transporter n=1 Tax=Pseudoroseicyclus tamaricis TaxID=2705421 RepID=A0A6B2JXL0_9RHOB|nr:cation diffusion facilitator family transporter [Pseudoroseicyclus tamaricis]NDV00092.1 cation diffusion facilitator family transporter [Pseudoroseicyclus tamaricis]